MQTLSILVQAIQIEAFHPACSHASNTLHTSGIMYVQAQTCQLQPELQCVKHSTPDWKPAWGKG